MLTETLGFWTCYAVFCAVAFIGVIIWHIIDYVHYNETRISNGRIFIDIIATLGSFMTILFFIGACLIVGILSLIGAPFWENKHSLKRKTHGK